MADIKTREKYRRIKTIDSAYVRRKLLIKARVKKARAQERSADEEYSPSDYALDKSIEGVENSTYIAAEKGKSLRKTIKIKLTDGNVIEVAPNRNRIDTVPKKPEANTKKAKKKLSTEKLTRSHFKLSEKMLRKKIKNAESARRTTITMVSALSISGVVFLIVVMIFSVIGASIYMLAPETDGNEEFIEFMDEEFSEYLAEHGGLFGLPISGMTKAHVSSPYGKRESPDGIGSVNHKGIDIAFPTGTPVLASEAGVVSFAGENGDFGICVVINHGYGIETVYAHLNSANALAGEELSRGDVLGKVGNTGVSTGPHLHFEVRVDGRPINPERGYLGIPVAS